MIRLVRCSTHSRRRSRRAGAARLGLLAALLLLGSAGASVLYAQAKAASPYRTMKLPNGLDVVVIENHNVPLATVSIAVRNGAFTEPDAFAGLSHLYEHMFFKANSVLPSQEQFMRRVRELGIVFNGYTSQEVVVYYFTFPSKSLDAGAQFMANAIKTPLFKEEELVKEREVVLGEFDRNEAQPTFALNYAIDSALWMPCVARKQPLGQRAVIKNATVTQMRMIKDLFYLPNNSALIVSGDVKAEAVFALATKYFSDWRKGSEPFPSYSPPPFKPLTPQLVVRDAKLPDVDIRLHFRGPSVGKEDADAYAGSLFSTLVTSATSRMYQRMVDSGIVTGYNAGYSIAHNVGTVNVYLRTSKDRARRALDATKAELRAMTSPGYFTDAEFEAARHIAADQRIFEQENPQGFAIGTTARWWSMTSLPYYLSYTDNVRKVTPAQVAAFVSKYVVGQPMIVGVGADHAVLDQLNITEEVLKW